MHPITEKYRTHSMRPLWGVEAPYAVQ